MKVIVILLELLLVFPTIFAQNEDKKGFIGLNIGTSYLLNKEPDNARVGANLNLINFGYEFKKKFGVSVKWMGGAHILAKDNQVGYGAIL